MIWTVGLAVAGCIGAWAAYVWLIKMPSTGELKFETLQPQTSPPGEAQFDRSLVERTVRAQLRDPNSAKFGPMLAYDYRRINSKPATVVCGSVSAKNNSGEYDSPKGFIFISNPTSALIDPDAADTRFANAWTEYCTGRR